MKLWEKMFSDGKAGTLKPVKKHSTLKRQTLSALTKRTLGGGSQLGNAVRLPPGEDLNDWCASHLVDFFNEISVLYGLVATTAQEKYPNPGDGFPPGFEYRWGGNGGKKATPIRVSSPEYVDYVMTWIEACMDNEELFPVTEDVPFPADFMSYVEDIFRRMFRIFAILFHRLFDEIEKLEAQAHLNSVFKHFMFFSFEFDLINDKEEAALIGPVNALRQEFEKQQLPGAGE